MQQYPIGVFLGGWGGAKSTAQGKKHIVRSHVGLGFDIISQKAVKLVAVLGANGHRTARVYIM